MHYKVTKVDCNLNEVMEEEKEESQPPVISFTERWRKTKAHWNSYPYVWASYFVVFGGLGVYSAYRWKALRKVEDELLRFQDKLKNTMTMEELERAVKDSQAGKF